MHKQEATESYKAALKQAQKEFKERQALGLNPYPEVLDDILEDTTTDSSIYIGLVEIPAERIVGVRSSGRVSAFSAGFLPLLGLDSEFAVKWISLCSDHLEDGIRDPIECFEYLGNFYVQEGNKRVSVLKWNEAPRITGIVRRVMPAPSEEPRIKAYMEFVEFHKLTGLYTVRFTKPGCYARLTAAVGIAPDAVWTEEERRRFRAYFQYFKDAFTSLGGEALGIQPEDALLLWLKLHEYSELGSLSAGDLKKSLVAAWENMKAIPNPDPLVKTEPPEQKASLLDMLTAPNKVQVAFVHQRTVETSAWTAAHEQGKLYLEEALGKSVTTRSYFSANTVDQAREILNQAVADGADVVFTTTPQLIAPSLKASVDNPKVRFLNCSVHMPYPTVRTYYSRMYEAKFITGAIAGAMSRDGNIGYVGSNPIYGVPASINAFALGAQLTNPEAVIHLKWSCLPGNPTQEFLNAGIRVISNRDAYSVDRPHHEYGTYMANDDNILVPLATPQWVWGKFYENVIRSILAGSWDKEETTQAVNHWWGMRSGVIDVSFSDSLPQGVRVLAELLRSQMRSGTLDPFLRPITDQAGTVRNDGTHVFAPDELLHMDWLCENVRGSIPHFDELLSFARPTVRALGIFPEQLDDEEVLP